MIGKRKMFDFIISTMLHVSILLIALIMIRPLILDYFGPSSMYTLWLTLPLCLIILLLQDTFKISFSVENELVYLVTSEVQQGFQQVFQINWLEMIYLLGLICFSVILVLVMLIQQFYMKRVIGESALKTTYSTPEIPAYISRYNIGPLAWGLLIPKVVLPSRFETLYNKTQRDLILAHERCHIRRKDLFWNLLAFALLLAFWFHPLAWIAFKRYQQDQELSCDQAILINQNKSEKAEYARALLSSMHVRPLPVLSLSFGKKGKSTMIQERIKHIKQTQAHNRLISTVMLGITGVLAAFTINANEPSLLALDELQKNISPIVRINPKYPIEAAQQGIEGWVTLEFGITKRGTVKNIQIVDASPSGKFDEAARKALSQWRFHPKHSDSTSTVQLEFKLAKDKN
jgi:TonB family protein